MAINAFVAQLVVDAEVHVQAITALGRAAAILAALVEIAIEDQMAILIGAGQIDIRRVLIAPAKQRLKRHDLKKFSDLIDKRTIQVNLAAICQGIPFIRVPQFGFVNRAVGGLRIHRDDLFTGQIAAAAVESAFVPETKSSPLAIRGTKGRPGEGDFNSAENRGSLIVEILVLFGKDEGSIAAAAE